ncbi:MAG: oxidoreductase, partial [Planctomycetota bacterium]
MRAAIVVLLLIFHESAGKAGEFWQLHSSGSTVSLRGISAVSESCCWASGARGTVLRTIDRGRTWTSVGPPVTEAADFRDVHAWNDSTAIIMSAGDVDRLYRTEDGGRTWQMVFEERATDAFFDGLTFDAAGNSGWLMGDPLDGQVYLLRTDDGGRSWVRHPAEQSPHVATGVAAFAASGTHLLLRSNRDLLIGLGGLPELTTENAAAASAGVLITTDQGKSWKQIPVPMQSNVSSGIFSLSDVSVDGDRLVAVGGDYRQVQNKDNN